MQKKYNKVLVLGIDGMDPKVTNQLMAEGVLPNLKKLSETGTFMELATSYPPHSPVGWTSIATGTNPGKHNLFDFIRRDPSSYLPLLALSKNVGGTKYESYLRGDPFWRLTTNAQVPTTVIRWPVTFPPEKVEGSMLSGLGVPDVKGLLSGYSFYTEKESKEGKSSNKVIPVKREGSTVKTQVFGPKVSKGGEIIEVKVPMEVEIKGNSVALNIQKNVHEFKVGTWSPWVRTEFKTGLFNSVYGIFKAYLVSTEPFEMYISTMQIDPENPMADISYPKEYSGDMAKKIGLYFTLGMPEETDGYVDGRIDSTAFLENIREIEEERDKMWDEEFGKFKNSDGGLLAFVYDSSDRVSHVFWEDTVLKESGGSSVKISEPVRKYAMEKDKFIGKVVSELPEDALLLIVSDHGFTSFERAVSMNSWLVENGFMTLVKELEPGEEGELFKYVDWEKTKAYALGFNSLYINVKGREGKGIVENREEVMTEIIGKLEKLVDPKNGKPVVNKAYRMEEIFEGDYTDNAPDILIGFHAGFRMAWQTAIGGFADEIIIDNTKKWNGDHLIDPKFVPGVLFSNIKIDGKSASQMDVAPTVLDALGVEIPDAIDGKSLLK